MASYGIMPRNTEDRTEDETVPSSQGRVNRRSILKGVASAGAMMSVSGVAAGAEGTSGLSAEEQNRIQELVAAFDDTEVAKATIYEQSGELFDTLHAKGYLESDGLEQLSVRDLPPHARKKGEEGIRVDAVKRDGAVTARLTPTWQKEEHTVQMFVEPQTETASAFVEPEDGSGLFFKSDGSSVTLAQSDCSQNGKACGGGIRCGDIQLSVYERIICFSGGNSSCHLGDFIGCKLPLTVNCQSC